MRVGLAFVLLLALPPQTPRNPVTNDGTSSSTKTAADHKKQSKLPPTILGTADKLSTPHADAEQDYKQQEPNDRVYKVDVVTQPPTGEPLFGLYLVATIFGVVVNAGVLFAIFRQNQINWRQLRTNVRAARAAKASAHAAIASAKAAKTSAQAIIIGNQPQLDLRANFDAWQTCIYPKLGVRRIELALSNTGLTSAYDCSWESWIELLEFPFVDFTPAAEHTAIDHKFSLSPGKPVIINVPIKRTITEPELNRIREGKLWVCVRLYVKYRDRFTPNRHCNFGYFVGPGGLSTLPRYNDSN
jgi:hypothetical protein